MQKKLHIRKGDTVMVIAGDSRGQQGKVLKVRPGKEHGHRGRDQHGFKTYQSRMQKVPRVVS